MKKTWIDPNDLPAMERATLRRIGGCVRPYARQAFVVVFCIIGAAILNLGPPWFVKRIVDVAIPAGDTRLLWIYCLAMVAGPIFAGLLRE